MVQCPECHAKNEKDATYCRNCGADLQVKSKSLVPFKANLPTLATNSQVSRGVAAGVGAIAVGVGLELLRRNLLTRLLGGRSVGQSLPALINAKDGLLPRSNKVTKLPKGYEVQETAVYVRRVIRRVN
jgi:hypothetical protein